MPCLHGLWVTWPISKRYSWLVQNCLSGDSLWMNLLLSLYMQAYIQPVQSLLPAGRRLKRWWLEYVGFLIILDALLRQHVYWKYSKGFHVPLVQYVLNPVTVVSSSNLRLALEAQQKFEGIEACVQHTALGSSGVQVWGCMLTKLDYLNAVV